MLLTALFIGRRIGDRMSENKIIKIDSLLNSEVDNFRIITDILKQRYPELQNNEQYQRVIKAIDIIEDAAEKLK